MRIGRTIYFLTGATVGYLAGSAAGRERYDAIVARLRALADEMGVPDLGTRLADRGTEVAHATTDTAGDLIDAAAQKATAVVEDISPAHKTNA